MVDPILGGALVDLDEVPWVPGLLRPADLAGLGPLMADRLGREAATQVCAGTMIEQPDKAASGSLSGHSVRR